MIKLSFYCNEYLSTLLKTIKTIGENLLDRFIFQSCEIRRCFPTAQNPKDTINCCIILPIIVNTQI